MITDASMDLKNGEESQHIHFIKGMATIKARIRTNGNSLYCLIMENKDKVRLYAKKAVNGAAEKYTKIFETNGLPAKAKACSYYESLKQAFYADNNLPFVTQK